MATINLKQEARQIEKARVEKKVNTTYAEMMAAQKRMAEATSEAEYDSAYKANDVAFEEWQKAWTIYEGWL